MIINRVILILMFALPFGLQAQSGIGWLFEPTPNDSIEKESFENHSSILPQIRQGIKSENGINFVKPLNFIPLVDGGINYQSELGYRITGGGIFESNPIWKKFYLRAGAIGGVESADSLTSANYEFTDSLKSVRSLFQPIVRFAYTPNHIFNFQIGHDKNFIGEGNRSLFLSDYGKPYYFGQLRARFWHVEYTMLYQFLNENYKSVKAQKFAASHYLSWNVTKKINLGIFETVIFQPKDTLLYRGFDVEYLNPVVFFRPQEYAIGSADNVLLGASFSVKHKKQTIYGQLIVDEFLLSEIRAQSGWWANKYGGQLGIKGYLKLRNEKFFYRVEANAVRPYTYAHVNSLQNYGNQNSTLSHPYGANFMEVLFEIKWQHKKWFTKFFTNVGYQGLDEDGKSYGGNVYLPYMLRPNDYNNKIGQGIRNNFFIVNIHAAYKLSEKGSIFAFAEIQYRFDSALSQKSHIIPFIGIRSYLWNDYRNY
jgi:hypothetical protein